MKLICSIKPRADNTVIVAGYGKTYAFTPTGDGETAAEVPDALAAKLLATGNFYPADRDDGAPVAAAPVTAAPAAKPPAATKTATAPAAKPAAANKAA